MCELDPYLGLDDIYLGTEDRYLIRKSIRCPILDTLHRKWFEPGSPRTYFGLRVLYSRPGDLYQGPVDLDLRPEDLQIGHEDPYFALQNQNRELGIYTLDSDLQTLNRQTPILYRKSHTVVCRGPQLTPGVDILTRKCIPCTVRYIFQNQKSYLIIETLYGKSHMLESEVLTLYWYIRPVDCEVQILVFKVFPLYRYVYVLNCKVCTLNLKPVPSTKRICTLERRNRTYQSKVRTLYQKVSTLISGW